MHSDSEAAAGMVSREATHARQTRKAARGTCWLTVVASLLLALLLFLVLNHYISGK